MADVYEKELRLQVLGETEDSLFSLFSCLSVLSWLKENQLKTNVVSQQKTSTVSLSLGLALCYKRVKRLMSRQNARTFSQKSLLQRSCSLDLVMQRTRQAWGKDRSQNDRPG